METLWYSTNLDWINSDVSFHNWKSYHFPWWLERFFSGQDLVYENSLIRTQLHSLSCFSSMPFYPCFSMDDPSNRTNNQSWNPVWRSLVQHVLLSDPGRCTGPSRVGAVRRQPYLGAVGYKVHFAWPKGVNGFGVPNWKGKTKTKILLKYHLEMELVVLEGTS